MNVLRMEGGVLPGFFFLNVTGGITPHLNIHYVAQNGLI